MSKITKKKFYLYGDSERPVVTIETDNDDAAFMVYSWFEDGGFMLRMSILPRLETDSKIITEEEFIKATNADEYSKLISDTEEDKI